MDTPSIKNDMRVAKYFIVGLGVGGSIGSASWLPVIGGMIAYTVISFEYGVIGIIIRKDEPSAPPPPSPAQTTQTPTPN
jgi:hypothetical protein